jgi:cell division protein FtsI/penicillin-binding protein 2
LALGVALVAGAPFALRALRGGAGVVASNEIDIAKVKRAQTAAIPTMTPPFSGLDLGHIALDDAEATAALAGGRTARLTIDPGLQRAAASVLDRHRLAEAAIVAMDPATGEILAWASHAPDGRDLCRDASAPAASVFKIVTGAALVEDAKIEPSTRECWAGGGEQRLVSSDLVQDPARDRYCVTLAGAMGHSTNAVFARLALRNLGRAQLEGRARAFGFGEAIPFDVDVPKSELAISEDPLIFARASAGFVGTTLSPLHAAWISAIVARGGEAVRPFVVREVRDAQGHALYDAPPPKVLRRVVAPDTAISLAQMMERTVTEGTAFRAFHDGAHRSFLHGISVAGKTGTLADASGKRLYTWFTAFAPSRPHPGERQIALGVLVVDPPKWKVKANVVAREFFEAYFFPSGSVARKK